MRKILGFLCILFLMLGTASAQQASSINPNVPAPGADVDSYTVRALALAAYNDITALMQDHNLPAIGSNQVLGTLSAAGVPSGLTIPGCNSTNSALVYDQATGFSCHVIAVTGSGTVTSVGFLGDGILYSATPTTPITVSGNITPSLVNHTGNVVFASPADGSLGAPIFRALVGADLPAPGALTFGGVKSIAATSHQWISSLGTNGVFVETQPVFSDVAGSVSFSQFPSFGANQILGALTTGSPSLMGIPSCSAANNSLAYSSGVGFICNTGAGGSPTGSAGGDLGGTYPNPTVVSVADVTTGTLGVANGGNGYGYSGGSGLHNMLGGIPRIPHWKKALATVLAGKGNAHVICIGDSVTNGYYSTNTGSGNMKTLGWCYQAGVMLGTSSGATVTNQNMYGFSSGDGATIDSRVSVGSGWSGSGVSMGGEMLTASSATSSTSFTPTIQVDTVKFCYPTNTTYGVLSYNFDGGANTNVTQTAGAPGYACTTATTTLGNHVINFNYNSGGAVWIDTIEAYNSATSQVLFENAGWDGSTSSQWNVTSNPWSPPRACGTLAPDLVIIALFINDMIHTIPLATAQANLAAIANGCQSGGNTDVIFMIMNHINPNDSTDPTSEATQLTYANNIRAVAAVTTNSPYVTGVPVADEFSNLISWNMQVNELNGMYLPGSWPQDLHPNYIIHGLMARDVANILAY